MVGEAENIPRAMAWLNEYSADVMLVDIGLPPPGDGFTIVGHAKIIRPQMQVVVLTAHLNEYIVSSCEEFGVDGFFNKRESALGRIAPLLATLAVSRSYFPPEYEAARRHWLADPYAISKRLGAREREVLRLIAQGLSDDEIAVALGISPATAATHKSSIMRKLHQPSVAKLISYAISHGYGRLRY